MSLKSFIFSTVVLSLLVVSTSGFIFDIEPHKEQCFYHDVRQDTNIGIRFQVLAGGFLDIDLTISDPERSVIYSGDRETEGKYSFTAHTPGIYSFCFSNKMSTMTIKSVALHVNIGEEDSNVPSSAAKRENLTPLENSIITLADGLHNIFEEQEYLTIRERVHRDTMESTNSRVLWFSVLEAAVLIGIATWQIYSIFRVFETKRPI